MKYPESLNSKPFRTYSSQWEYPDFMNGYKPLWEPLSSDTSPRERTLSLGFSESSKFRGRLHDAFKLTKSPSLSSI